MAGYFRVAFFSCRDLRRMLRGVSSSRFALATGIALATRSTMATSLHTFSGKTIAGGSLSMDSLAGKPVIMLNVASR